MLIEASEKVRIANSRFRLELLRLGATMHSFEVRLPDGSDDCMACGPDGPPAGLSPDRRGRARMVIGRREGLHRSAPDQGGQLSPAAT